MEGGSDLPPQASSSTYVAPDGSIKPLVPRNVNINQFYPQVEYSSSKDRAPAKLGEFVNTPPAVSNGSDEDKETNSTPDSKSAEQLQGQSSQSLSTDEDGGGVFAATQVDEETIEAAKQRQQTSTLFDPESWEATKQTVTMKHIMDEKIKKHFDLAEMLHERGDYRAAITHYNKALTLKPKEHYYYARRADSYLLLTDFQSAILNYKRACVLSPENFHYYSRLAFVYYFHGQCLFDQKLFPEALESFSRAAEMRPEVVGYHTRSIACLAALQRHGECLALVNKRLEVEQENADLYVMRARLHQLFRNTTLCYYDIKDALSLCSHHPEAVRLMAGLQQRADDLRQQALHFNLVGRHRDALHKVTLAIETNPAVADFHVLRGALHRRLADFNAAIDDYLLALDKTDHNEEHPVYVDSQRQLLLTYNDFAIECFSKGFYEEAIILLNKAIKGEKTEKGLYVNRGDCFYREGELQFALADYHQALEMDGTDNSVRARVAVIHNDYALHEYNEKNYKEAESRFTLAVQHNPRVAEYYISRARVRHLLENAGAARSDLLLALHLDPNQPEILSVMTRLFPGKSVRDVLQSPAAARARQALMHLVPTAAPVALQPLGSEQSEESCSQSYITDPVSDPSEDSIPPPIAGASWKPGGCFPDLRACMKEKEFHIRVAKDKQMINSKVKTALNERRSLSSHLQGVNINSVPSPPMQPKPSSMAVKTGWRKFSPGIGVAK